MTFDNQLQRDVLEELKWEPGIDASGTSVRVHEGTVTLRGSVSSQAEKDVAEEVVRRVPGVLAIANELVVRRNTSAQMRG